MPAIQSEATRAPDRHFANRRRFCRSQPICKSAWVLAVFLVLTCGITFSGQIATAHQPYFGARFDVILPDGSSAELAAVFGDGLIGPDPVSAAVFTKNGDLLALSPYTFNIFIDCLDGLQLLNCRIVDPAARTLWQFTPGPQPKLRNFLTDDGRPAVYPEFADAGGFTASKAPLGEVAKLEMRDIILKPARSTFAVSWTAFSILSAVGAVFSFRYLLQTFTLRLMFLNVGFCAVALLGFFTLYFLVQFSAASMVRVAIFGLASVVLSALILAVFRWFLVRHPVAQ